MTLLILYLLLAIVVSFLCSIAEAVLLSLQPSYIALKEKEGAASAARLKQLKDNPDRPLAAILTANTIAHTVGAAGVGAQSAAVFGSAYLGLTSAVLTFLVLVFSEIIPKTLGATYWKALAAPTARLISWMTWILYPIVLASEQLTKLFSGSGHPMQGFSRAEMAAMADIGARQGLLEDQEHEIIQNLMVLRRHSVRQIMTPRPVLFSVSASMTVQAYFREQIDQPFSRILLYADRPDDVIGYALKADIFKAQAQDQFDRPLLDFKRDILVLRDNCSASEVFDHLLHHKAHITLIVDEYGSLCGLVTLEDVLETLIGREITDELDTVEDMQDLASERWKERVKNLGLDEKDFVAADQKKTE